jgi:hypothetical protein
MRAKLNDLIEVCECGHRKDNHVRFINPEDDIETYIMVCQVCGSLHTFKLDNLKSVQASDELG